MNWNNAAQNLGCKLMFVGITSVVVLVVSGFRSTSSAARLGELQTNDVGSQINVRANPSSRSQALHYAYSGDRVQILQQQQGDDEWIWYYVKFDNSGATGWVRSDLFRRETLSAATQPSSQASRSAAYPLPQTRNISPVSPVTVSSVNSQSAANSRNGTIPQSGAVLPTSTAARNADYRGSATYPLPQSVTPPAVSVANRGVPNYSNSSYGNSTVNGATFTQEQINYFMEIAMGSEFGANASPKIHKWQSDVRIQYSGSPTQADLATLNTVIGELNGLIGGAIRLQLVQSNPNVTIHFVPEPQFRNYEPRYVPVNFGFFATDSDAKGAIQKANILINSRGVTQKERSHLIREELTQSLGLMRDSLKYADSMFYQPWTDVTQYSEIDKALIRMLYSPSVQIGMTKTQVLAAVRTLQASRSNPSVKF